MRSKVEDRDPRDAYIGVGFPMDPYHVISSQYDDDIGRSMNLLR